MTNNNAFYEKDLINIPSAVIEYAENGKLYDFLAFERNNFRRLIDKRLMKRLILEILEGNKNKG